MRKPKTVKRPKVVHRKRKPVSKAMTNLDEKKPDAPPTVEQFGHKHPNVGPTTNKVLPDWNQFRDYENFNPTAEK